jgi:O-antigen/teichoic acid export membrane protein
LISDPENMLVKLKKTFTSDLVKVSSLNAISTLIRMLTGFISVKIVAKQLANVGDMALLGQLNNFSALMLVFSTGGIAAGVTKYVAQYADSPKKSMLFLATSFRITLTLAGICGLVLMIGSSYFAELILKDAGYKYVFIIFGITIIFYALNTLLISIMNGFKEFRKYVLANICGTIIGLILTIVLTLAFDIYGALVAAVTYQSVVFFVTFSIVRRASWFDVKKFFAPFSRSTAIKFGHYSLMALVSAVSVHISQLVVRNYITVHTGLTTQNGLDNAGLWEGMNRISMMYLMVITTSLSVYYLPKLAGLKTQGEIRTEIFNVYKLVLPFLVLISSAIYICRYYIIHILFDDKYNGMENLFVFQLAGDFFKIASWILAYQLIAKAMSKTFIITEFAFSASFVLFSMLFVNMYGNIGATIGYALNYLIYFILMIILFRKTLFSHG